MKITIAGVDYADYIDMESIQVDNTVIMTTDTMNFTITLNGELPRPKRGNEVIWINNNVREFAGVVTRVQENDIGTNLEYAITVSSYEIWLNRRMVVNFYDSMTADQMVKRIISTFANGFTTTNVKNGYTIPPLYFNYVRVSDAIKKIAEQIEFGWYIDYYKDIHFYPLESFPSVLPSNTLLVDTDTTNYGDLQFSEDGAQLKTRIYLKGFKSRVGTPMTLNFIADGSTSQWNLGYKPSHIKGDITAKVGGVPLTIKRDIVDGSPNQNVTDTSSLYINYSQNLARLNYTPASGVVVSITMYYLTDTIIMREDPQAQAVAASADGNGDGRYDFAVTEQSLSQATIDAANARGDMLLYKYNYPQLTATFTSYTQGWRAGQFFYMNSKRRMGGLNEKMYIHQVKKKIIRTDNSINQIRYEVSVANIPYLVQ